MMKMVQDWEEVHCRALRCFNKDIGIKYFHCCGITSVNSNNIMTSEEEQEILEIGKTMDVMIVLIVLRRRKKRKRVESI